MKNRRVFKSLIGFLVITGVFSITVFAKYFTSSDSVTNNFGAGSINVGIAENFTPKQSWDGKDADKNVKVKNTGKNGELIRVSIIPRWVDENGNPWPGDANLVKLNLKNIVNNFDSQKVYENLWIDGGDGYYYYSSVLKSGTSEDIKKEEENSMNTSERYKESLIIDKDGKGKANYTSEILSSVRLDMSNLSNEEKERYNGKKLIVDVNTEAIEPRKEAVSKKWNDINSSLKTYLDKICNKEQGGR